MNIPGWLLQHTAIVEPFLGTSANGPVYGPEFSVRCLWEDTRNVRRRAEDREVISSSRLFCNINEEITPESRILVNGNSTTVALVHHREAGGLPVPEHLEVLLR